MAYLAYLTVAYKQGLLMATSDFSTQISTLSDCIGHTPLVRLARFSPSRATILAKLEGNNPAGSVKDRAAFNMIYQAEQRGSIKSGDT